MTSFAFIMGVVPLVMSSGAGAEMRHAMGEVENALSDQKLLSKQSQQQDMAAKRKIQRLDRSIGKNQKSVNHSGCCIKHP